MQKVFTDKYVKEWTTGKLEASLRFQNLVVGWRNISDVVDGNKWVAGPVGVR
jgi:hypothetical protein